MAFRARSKTTQRLRRNLAADISYGMRTSNSPSAAGCAQARRRRRACATLALTLAALCVILRLGAPAHAQTPVVQLWVLLNAKCKGGSPDDPKTQQACEKREKYNARLKRRGCVYQEDGDWWKCPGR
jgi:hypothetical protein